MLPLFQNVHRVPNLLLEVGNLLILLLFLDRLEGHHLGWRHRCGLFLSLVRRQWLRLLWWPHGNALILWDGGFFQQIILDAHHHGSSELFKGLRKNQELAVGARLKSHFSSIRFGADILLIDGHDTPGFYRLLKHNIFRGFDQQEMRLRFTSGLNNRRETGGFHTLQSDSALEAVLMVPVKKEVCDSIRGPILDGAASTQRAKTT